MILEADGKTFELQFAELNVALKLPLPNKSVGANTSSTSTVNTGTKAKIISVAGVLAFKYQDHLQQLIKVAEAVNDDGSRKIYTISDDTAKPVAFAR